MVCIIAFYFYSIYPKSFLNLQFTNDNHLENIILSPEQLSFPLLPPSLSFSPLLLVLIPPHTFIPSPFHPLTLSHLHSLSPSLTLPLTLSLFSCSLFSILY